MRSRSAALAACLSLALVALPLVAAEVKARYDANKDAFGGSLLTPTRDEVSGRKYYFEVPHNPVGVLFMAHGCVHDASDFWPPSDACKECSGLPEEVSHTKQALARGYAVIAINSKNRDFDNRCFGFQDDRWGVKYILESWLAEHKLDHLPVFALGISAGASFCLKLPRVTRINGVISEVLGVAEEIFETPRELEETYPPAVFIDMQRDSAMSAKIGGSMRVISGFGVPTERIAVDPRPVPHSFFSDRSEYISDDLSRNIVNGLRKIGMLDEQGYVTTDPRYTRKPWKEELGKEVKEVKLEKAGDSSGLAPNGAMISEQMNLAWAKHEIISDYLTPCLAWLEARGAAPMDRLLRELQIQKRIAELSAARQAAPRAQDDEALKLAATQVKEQLSMATTPANKKSYDNWGDMYAAYVDWLEVNPAGVGGLGNITLPAWRASRESGKWSTLPKEPELDLIGLPIGVAKRLIRQRQRREVARLRAEKQRLAGRAAAAAAAAADAAAWDPWAAAAAVATDDGASADIITESLWPQPAEIDAGKKAAAAGLGTQRSPPPAQPVAEAAPSHSPPPPPPSPPKQPPPTRPPPKQPPPATVEAAPSHSLPPLTPSPPKRPPPATVEAAPSHSPPPLTPSPPKQPPPATVEAAPSHSPPPLTPSPPKRPPPSRPPPATVEAAPSHSPPPLPPSPPKQPLPSRPPPATVEAAPSHSPPPPPPSPPPASVASAGMAAAQEAGGLDTVVESKSMEDDADSKDDDSQDSDSKDGGSQDGDSKDGSKSGSKGDSEGDGDELGDRHEDEER